MSRLPGRGLFVVFSASPFSKKSVFDVLESKTLDLDYVLAIVSPEQRRRAAGPSYIYGFLLLVSHILNPIIYLSPACDQDDFKKSLGSLKIKQASLFKITQNPMFFTINAP